jgi:hypothetical protein
MDLAGVYDPTNLFALITRAASVKTWRASANRKAAWS